MNAGLYVQTALCNGKYAVIDGELAQKDGVFAGTYPYVYIDGPGLVTGQTAINAFGDVVFDSGRDDEFYYAYNLTAHAPEPSSLILLGTGALGLLGAARRRLRL